MAKLKCIMWLIAMCGVQLVSNGATPDTVATNESSAAAFRAKDSLHVKRVKILEYKKKIDRSSVVYEEYGKRCGEWRLSEKQLEKILVKSYTITEHEIRFFFSTVPCHYEGVARINDEVSLRFEVNAGSYAIFFEDAKDPNNAYSLYYLGYFGPEIGFIEPPGIAVDQP